MKADKAHITRSIKIARGQLDGILRMIEEDRYCVDISNQLLSFLLQIIADHYSDHHQDSLLALLCYL